MAGRIYRNRSGSAPSGSTRVMEPAEQEAWNARWHAVGTYARALRQAGCGGLKDHFTLHDWNAVQHEKSAEGLAELWVDHPRFKDRTEAGLEWIARTHCLVPTAAAILERAGLTPEGCVNLGRITDMLHSRTVGDVSYDLRPRIPSASHRAVRWLLSGFQDFAEVERLTAANCFDPRMARALLDAGATHDEIAEPVAPEPEDYEVLESRRERTRGWRACVRLDSVEQAMAAIRSERAAAGVYLPAAEEPDAAGRTVAI